MPGTAKDRPLPPRSDAIAHPSDTPVAPASTPPRQDHPWRSLLHALLWLLAAELASVCSAVLAGIVAGVSQGVAHRHGAEGWKPDLLFYGLVATLALQATLLFAGMKQ